MPSQKKLFFEIASRRDVMGQVLIYFLFLISRSIYATE